MNNSGSKTLALMLTLAASASASAASPPATLSETGLFAAGDPSAIAADNLLFAPQFPLWSDGAAKRRWIHLPVGTAIDASRPDAWEFPAGTRFWKELSFAGRPVETRFLQKQPDGSWLYAAYVWQADGRDATLAPARGAATSVEVAPGVRHTVPGQSDCRACHEGRPNNILGFTLLQLAPSSSSPSPSPSSRSPLGLRSLIDRNLLRNLPPALATSPPRIHAATPTARAALGYLYANCSGCHNGDGPLAELELSFDYPAISGARAHDAGAAPGVATTVGRPSRFVPPSAMPEAPCAPAVRIVPGRAAASTVVARMRSRDPLVQMPPLGTRVVDDAGVALVARWIDETLQAPNPTRKEESP